MNLGQHQEQFAIHISSLIHYAVSKGYGVRIGEVERTAEQQKLYVDSGRSKTMNSMHLYKCAADLHFTLDGKICYPKEIGSYWESLDVLNSWGGNWKSFKDAPHFERKVK